MKVRERTMMMNNRMKKIVCALVAVLIASLTTCSTELIDLQNLQEKAKTVTLTFKADGGNWSGSTNDVTLTGTEGTELTVPETPVKSGYEFSAWNPTISETFPAVDTTYTATWNDVAPAAVASLTATTGSAQVTLHWPNPSDSDFSKTMGEYTTTADPATVLGTYEGTGTAGATETCSITGLANGTSYTFTVYAQDTAGNKK